VRYYDQSTGDATKQMFLDAVVFVLLGTSPIWLPVLKAAMRIYSWRLNRGEECL